MIRLADLYEEWPSTGKCFDLRIDRVPSLLTDEEWRLDVSPPYQRRHRWSEEQRELFMGHVLGGGRVAPLVINDPPRLRGSQVVPRVELADGKQRFTAICRWLEGEIAAQIGDRRIWRSETDGRFRNDHVIHFEVISLRPVEVMRLYLRMNRGATPHTPEELTHVEELLRAAESEEDRGR
jgi:hypothetical protein